MTETTHTVSREATVRGRTIHETHDPDNAMYG
jgi:hypothetical protein